MSDGPAQSELPPIVRGPVERNHLVEWCAAENDYYALHYDERQARRLGFEKPLVQRTHKYALMGQYLRAAFGAGATIARIAVTYLRPDSEGSKLTLSGRVTAASPTDSGRRYKVDPWATGEDGERTATGHAVVDVGEPEACAASWFWR